MNTAAYRTPTAPQESQPGYVPSLLTFRVANQNIACQYKPVTIEAYGVGRMFTVNTHGDDAVARRLVACFNACNGLSIEELEAMTADASGSLAVAYDACNELRKRLGAELVSDQHAPGTVTAALAEVASNVRLATAHLYPQQDDAPGYGLDDEAEEA